MNQGYNPFSNGVLPTGAPVSASLAVFSVNDAVIGIDRLGSLQDFLSFVNDIPHVQKADLKRALYGLDQDELHFRAYNLATGSNKKRLKYQYIDSIVDRLLDCCTAFDTYRVENDIDFQNFQSCDAFRMELYRDFGYVVLSSLMEVETVADDLHLKTAARVEQRTAEDIERHEKLIRDWPQLVPEDVSLSCCASYREATNIRVALACAVCARARQGASMCDVKRCDRSDFEFDLLRITDERFIRVWIVGRLSAEFLYGDSELDGLMLYKEGLRLECNDVVIQLCEDCGSSLRRSELPKYALKNDLYVGRLPAEFEDMTWVEEMLCCIYRTTAHVTRIYNTAGSDGALVYHGNVCAHETNLVSIATELPRKPADVNGTLSVTFVGPKRVQDLNKLKIFRVRKELVWSFLLMEKTVNPLFKDIHLSRENMDMYNADDIIPGFEQQVIYDDRADADSLFKKETAGLDPHPAEQLTGINNPKTKENEDSSEGSDIPVLVENMGVLDADGDAISGRSFTASALRNLASSDNATPADFVSVRGIEAMREYNNPDLLMGMFPKLFFLGISGFEQVGRAVPIGYEKHANYLLDLHDRRFRCHRFFPFVVLNIIQRRLSHLHTHFTVSRDNFESVSRGLVNISPDVLRSAADHLEREGKYSELSGEERKALDLLKQVNTIAAKIPGSQASKVYSRNEIRALMGFFNMPIGFFTLNPNPNHSPIAQVMFGDTTIDLNECYPELVGGSERARRLAKDPVAGADFFDFMVECFFIHLLGWDRKKNCSTEKGGIFGHLKAYYGTCEYTERGVLHGHFLIWLEGSVNLDELHRRMRDNVEYKDRVLRFFEQMSQHHLPDVELTEAEICEPRIERPPIPPVSGCSEAMRAQWNEVFVHEIKMCGEVLQRHTCREVCHKYGNVGRCRFQFPHDVVEKSYFVPKTNSIYMLCKDANVNSFNPYILVFCRHNHDVTNILSGRAAKAAMMYITDYITKMDAKTHEMLSILARSASQVTTGETDSFTARAKNLLHKCLSQFTRRQQIHAQQAVRYLRGKGDCISSHETAPMLSNAIVRRIRLLASKQSGNRGAVNEDDEDDEIEKETLAVNYTAGRCVNAVNQVDDYWLRHDSLATLGFYDFVRCFRKQKLESDYNEDGSFPKSVRQNARYRFLVSHPQYGSHMLVMHTDDRVRPVKKNIIPRVVGLSIPRITQSEHYALFMIAHFIPWGENLMLPDFSNTFEVLFQNCTMSDRHSEIIRNWDAIHECEDERDAERMKKREALAKESKILNASLTKTQVGVDVDENGVDIGECDELGLTRDTTTISALLKLTEANWFRSPTKSSNDANEGMDIDPINESEFDMGSIGTITSLTLKAWAISRKEQEYAIVKSQADHTPASVPASDVTPDRAFNSSDNARATPSLVFVYNVSMPPEIPYLPNAPDPNTAEGVLIRIGLYRELNEEQWIAYRIAADRFLFESLKIVPTNKRCLKPLRSFLTGPGGTGKSHVVITLKMLMTAYGVGHQIRFVAPTGSAATIIDGTTVHASFSLSVNQSNGKSNRVLNTSDEKLTCFISVVQRQRLRTNWKGVRWILLDEVSLLSEQLLCEIDYSLRYAMENEDWFGGINVIFSGDIYQYPPCREAALYTPISLNAPDKQSEFKKRLGRLAWKTVDTVVELHQQQRMKSDIRYANAVLRLRKRICTWEDMDLFNSRRMKTDLYPTGIDLSKDGYLDAVALVHTNFTRECLSNEKAKSNAGSNSQIKLVKCAAMDLTGGGKTKHELDNVDRARILNKDVTSFTKDKSLPGFIPLYDGMPVILRMRNLSTLLKIANGSQGVVKKIQTYRSESGHDCASCVLVYFPTSPVHFPGLPVGYYPIEPISWTFWAPLTVPGEEERKSRKIIRWQLPIQPAFAITGHSAQGKTIPKIIVDLKQGGCAAYVGASRAQSREGLIITSEVTLNDLNKNLSGNLLRESNRLDALRHNTLVDAGLLLVDHIPVPDPESELKYCPTGKFGNQDKRKADQMEPDPGANDANKHPKLKKSNSESDGDQSLLLFPTAGCTWDNENWSCSYDSVFMSVFCLFMDSTVQYRELFSLASDRLHSFAFKFESLLASIAISKNRLNFNKERNLLRLELYGIDRLRFPLHGPRLVSAFDVLDEATGNGSLSNRIKARFICDSCYNSVPVESNLAYVNLPTVVCDEDWSQIVRADPSVVTLQEWLQLFIVSDRPVCNRMCENGHILTFTLRFELAFPSLLLFEQNPDMSPHVLPPYTVPCIHENTAGSYRLRAIIYSGAQHFTARVICRNGSVWKYNDMINNGSLLYEHRTAKMTSNELFTMGTRHAHIFVYALDV